MRSTFIRAEALAAVLVLAVTLTASAQSTDEAALFKEASTREAALRRDLSSATPAHAAPTLRRLRTLVVAYEDLARLFPQSGQADKALWQGANLSADAFWQLGYQADRDAALRLLDALATTFGGSSYARQAKPLEKRLNAAPVATAAPPATTPAPVRPARLTPPASAPAVQERQPQSRATTVAAAPEAAPSASVVAAPAPAAPASSGASAVTLTAVRRDQTADAARVVIELDREVSYHTERIAGPDRVFIDLPATRAVTALKAAVLPFTDDVVRRIRIGAQPGRITRVVLDIEGGGRHSVYTLYNPYRIVVDVERAVTTPAPSPVSAPPAAPLHVASVRTGTPAPDDVPVAPVAGAVSVLHASTAPATPRHAPPAPAAPQPAPSVADIVAAVPPPPPGLTDAPPPAAPAVNGRGGFSLSRQLGLGIARIVIDAGHGGHDPGARGKGLSEAELTLDVAQRLEKLLLRQPGVEVIQTRRTNAYVALEERTEIANRSNADLFISIHANASEDARARGVETYFLNFAPNADAEAIAARENAGSTRQMRQLPDLVRAIALNNKIDESRDLAAAVQQALYTQVKKADRRSRNLGVKQAPFMVLVGASMPSVLTEISFLTNRQDAGLLATDQYRQQIADALLDGITRYQQALKKAPSVASQQGR
jgi:N-acetylmuramoyl-L-alanine amidase